MTTDPQSAREDLAFLRALLEDESAGPRSFAEGYLAAGLIYGGQMILHAMQAMGWIGGSALGALAIGVGPTVLFLPVLALILIRNRRTPVHGAVARAVGGIFAVVGLANFVLIAVIGSVAWREGSVTTWLIYPCAVFALQGAAWLFAFTMRRRTWLLWVAIGWFVCAVAMALTVTMTSYFILFAGLGLWLCMALPGWIMLRRRDG
jgi:hypothetical protein